MQWGSDTYRRGALARLDDAKLLKEAHSYALSMYVYALSMYVAGLAAEGMLRAVHWLRSRELDERHDLKRMAVRIESLGLLRSGDKDSDFVSVVQAVARRWSNLLRFADYEQLTRFLTDIGEVRKREEGEVRRVCAERYSRCSEVVKRCETLLRRQVGEGL